MLTEITKELIQKVNDGDHITNIELTSLIVWYVDLERKLVLLEPQFHIARVPVSQMVNRLADYQSARRRHG